MPNQQLALLPLVVVAFWLITLAVLSGRGYYLNPYAVLSVLPPALEPFAMPPAAFPIGIAIAACWTWLVSRATDHRRASIYLAIAAAPFVLWMINLIAIGRIAPMFIEALCWLLGLVSASVNWRMLLALSNPSRKCSLLSCQCVFGFVGLCTILRSVVVLPVVLVLRQFFVGL